MFIEIINYEREDLEEGSVYSLGYDTEIKRIHMISIEERKREYG